MIVESSFSPILRLRISSRPAAVSKRHFRPSLTIGIGDGQRSSPTTRVYFALSTFSSVAPFPSRSPNPLSALASSTASPESTFSRSGPKIADSFSWSAVFTASISACTASWGVGKSLCFGAFASAAGAGPANKANARTNGAIVAAAKLLVSVSRFIGVSLPQAGQALAAAEAAPALGWPGPAGLPRADRTRRERGECRGIRRVDGSGGLRNVSAVPVESRVGGVEVPRQDLVLDRPAVRRRRRTTYASSGPAEIVEARPAVHVIVAAQRLVVHAPLDDASVDRDVAVTVIDVGVVA